jgi:hypothetical protein
MVQWIGIGLTVIGMAYTGWRQLQMPQLTSPPIVVQSPLPIMTWQVAFDPNSGKLYHLHPDGKWYEQVPQIRYDQGQHSPPVGNWQGAQSAPLGQRLARQSSQAGTNPWFR